MARQKFSHYLKKKAHLNSILCCIQNKPLRNKGYWDHTLYTGS